MIYLCDQDQILVTNVQTKITTNTIVTNQAKGI